MDSATKNIGETTGDGTSFISLMRGRDVNVCTVSSFKHKPVENCIVKVRSLTYDDQGCITGYHRSTGHRDYNLLVIDQNECTRCGVCAEVCPVECIPLQDIGKRMVPVTEFAAATAVTSDPLCSAGNKS